MEDEFNFDDLKKKYENEYIQTIKEILDVIKQNEKIGYTPLVAEILINLSVYICKFSCRNQEIADDCIDKLVKNSKESFEMESPEDIDILKKIYKNHE